MITNVIIKLPHNQTPALKDFSKATNRELECLHYFAIGKSSSEIGELLDISKRTVESHIKNIKSKVGVKKTTALIYYAVKQHLI